MITNKKEKFLVPGFKEAFDPKEAEEMGAFEEEAVSIEDAEEATYDFDGVMSYDD